MDEQEEENPKSTLVFATGSVTITHVRDVDGKWLLLTIVDGPSEGHTVKVANSSPELAYFCHPKRRTERNELEKLVAE